MAGKYFKGAFDHWQPIIPAVKLDELTNGLFRWRTIKNLRSKGKIPEDCFMKLSPRKIVILRDPFLEWAEAYSRSHN